MCAGTCRGACSRSTHRTAGAGKVTEPRLSPAPRERGGVGAAEEGESTDTTWKGAAVGKGHTERDMERGDSGTGAPQAGLTIDWPHTGRCFAWQGRAGAWIGLPGLGEGQ